MNFFKILFLFLLISIPCVINATEKYDFRTTNWGMSLDEVLSIEQSKLDLKSGISLTYITNYFGQEAYLRYNFINNKLIRSSYFLFFYEEKEYNNIKKKLFEFYKNNYTELPDNYKKILIDLDKEILNIYSNEYNTLIKIKCEEDLGWTILIEFENKNIKEFFDELNQTKTNNNQLF